MWTAKSGSNARRYAKPVSDESHALGWFSIDDLEAIDTDDSVRRLFRLAM